MDLIFRSNPRVYIKNKNSLMNNSFEGGLASHLDKMSIDVHKDDNMVFPIQYHVTLQGRPLRECKIAGYKN